MKKFSVIVSCVIVILFMFMYNVSIRINYKPSDYDLRLIDYFKQVALNSEYDDSPRKILKWNKSMIIFIFKDDEYSEQIKVIYETIHNMNKIFSDGFKIQVTDDFYKSNSVLYLGKRENIEMLYPYLFEGINGSFAGLASIEFNNEDYGIEKVDIFIDTEQPFEIQECTILEEITQSIGLMNDSEKYSNSVFYENKIRDSIYTKNYSNLDFDIIELLYHSKMKSGLDLQEAEDIIKEILKDNLAIM